MSQLIPTNTYGETKKVPPKEASSILGYQDKEGNDWICIEPDPAEMEWISKWVEKEGGLDAICEKYPYQPLRVCKKNGMLAPIGDPKYNCKLTNCLHLTKHYRKDAANEKAASNSVFDSLIEKPSTSTHDNTFTIESEQNNAQIHDCGQEWKQAYDLNPKEPTIHETNFEQTLVQNEEDMKSRYTFDASKISGSLLPEGGLDKVPYYHPNIQGIRLNMQNPVAIKFQQPVSNTQPNPFSYTPDIQNSNRTSYLPQYRSSIQYPF